MTSLTAEAGERRENGAKDSGRAVSAIEGYDPIFFLLRFPSRHCCAIQSAVTRFGIGLRTRTRRPVPRPSPSLKAAGKPSWKETEKGLNKIADTLGRNRLAREIEAEEIVELIRPIYERGARSMTSETSSPQHVVRPSYAPLDRRT